MFDPFKPATPEALSEFEVRIIVAGSRGYTDYRFFSQVMTDVVSEYGDRSLIFISGAARSGADAMIIQWCRENHLPWVEFPADWKACGKSAGYRRNLQMSVVATHLIAFWDTKSRGTRHMIEIARKGGLQVKVLLVDETKTANEFSERVPSMEGIFNPTGWVVSAEL